MTKTELQNNHPELAKPETIELLNDVATHMRRAMPMAVPYRPDPNIPPMDGTTMVRQLGIQEGWQYAMEYLQGIHVPVNQAQQQPAKERPYSQPPGPVIVPKEEVKS